MWPNGFCSRTPAAGLRAEPRPHQEDLECKGPAKDSAEGPPGQVGAWGDCPLQSWVLTGAWPRCEGAPRGDFGAHTPCVAHHLAVLPAAPPSLRPQDQSLAFFLAAPGPTCESATRLGGGGRLSGQRPRPHPFLSGARGLGRGCRNPRPGWHLVHGVGGAGLLTGVRAVQVSPHQPQDPLGSWHRFCFAEPVGAGGRGGMWGPDGVRGEGTTDRAPGPDRPELGSPGQRAGPWRPRVRSMGWWRHLVAP